MKENADHIFINGRIYTVDSSFSVRQAMAIADGMIVGLGSNDEVLSGWKSDVVTDLAGKPVYPGFNDGHCHFYGYALNQYKYIDLNGTSSFDQILGILKEKGTPQPGAWILGRGWDQNDWPSKAFPDNHELNELFPFNPVLLTRVDGHAVLVNAKALETAGITSKTKIDGGEVLLWDGVPTGILLDRAADQIQALVPDPGLETKVSALMKAQADCFAVGLTSVSDAGLEYETIMLIDSLQSAGTLKMRVNAMLSPTDRNIVEFVKRGPFQKDRLTVNSIKLYADGALGSRGALLLEPYSDDPGNYGLMMSPEGFYRYTLQLAFEHNFQVNTHCIGDSANRMMLYLYGEVLKGHNDRRWRIEHAQVINDDDFQLFGKYSIIPSIQSTHATSDMYWAGERLGPDRVKGAYAYKKLLEQNGWLVNGTDFPIEHISPVYTFYAAVSRKDLKGYPEGGFQPGNALSRQEALQSITIWPAKGSFEELRKGSLEIGKLADFVILEKDIMEAEMPEIPGISVMETYLEGEKVY